MTSNFGLRLEQNASKVHVGADAGTHGNPVKVDMGKIDKRGTPV